MTEWNYHGIFESVYDSFFSFFVSKLNQKNEKTDLFFCFSVLKPKQKNGITEEQKNEVLLFWFQKLKNEK